jgi:DNA replication ATP-dependent helicase Dna2
MTANERQEHGRCFADMVLLVDPTTQALSKDGRYQFTYTFKRRTQDGPSLISGHLGVSEFVTISVEPNLLLVARGTIISLHPDRITVALDKSLNIPTLLTRSGTEELVFRIDKDEVGIGMTRIRDNLAQLFYAGGDSKRLSLVVDLRVPEFAPPEDVSNLSTKLNPNQLQAVEKVLSAKDYALILGMPGTGKTTTIAEIIKILVQRGNSVLFASYTHSAVDTILLKLKDQELDVLRVGNADKVAPSDCIYMMCKADMRAQGPS